MTIFVAMSFVVREALLGWVVVYRLLVWWYCLRGSSRFDLSRIACDDRRRKFVVGMTICTLGAWTKITGARLSLGAAGLQGWRSRPLSFTSARGTDLRHIPAWFSEPWLSTAPALHPTMTNVVYYSHKGEMASALHIDLHSISSSSLMLLLVTNTSRSNTNFVTRTQ